MASGATSSTVSSPAKRYLSVAPTTYFFPPPLLPAEPGAGINSQWMTLVVFGLTVPVPSTALMFCLVVRRKKNFAERSFGLSVASIGVPASSVILTTTETFSMTPVSVVLWIFISASKAWRSSVNYCLMSIFTPAHHCTPFVSIGSIALRFSLSMVLVLPCCGRRQERRLHQNPRPARRGVADTHTHLRPWRLECAGSSRCRPSGMACLSPRCCSSERESYRIYSN